METVKAFLLPRGATTPPGARRPMRLYRPRVSTWWWTRKRTYFVFVMRELSSIFVAWFVVYLLLFVYAVGRARRPTSASSTGPRRRG